MTLGFLVWIFTSSALVSGLAAVVAGWLSFKLTAYLVSSMGSNHSSSDLRRKGSATSELGNYRHRSSTASQSRYSFPSNTYRTWKECRLAGDLNRVASCICAWMFTLYLFLRSVVSAYRVSAMLDSNKSNQRTYDDMNQNQKWIRGVSMSLLMLITCDYGLISAIVFDRLITVFINSQYRVSHQTIITVRSIIVIAWMSSLIGFVCYFWVSDRFGRGLILVGLTVFPFILLFCTVKLWRITWQIAQSLSLNARSETEWTSESMTAERRVTPVPSSGDDPRTHGSMVMMSVVPSTTELESQPSNSFNTTITMNTSEISMDPSSATDIGCSKSSNDAVKRVSSVVHSKNEHLTKKVRELVNGALRLTVISITVVLSSLLVFLLSLALSVFFSHIVLLSLHIAAALDILCNVFALVASLKRFESLYMIVFSGVHHYWMDRLVPSE